MRRFAVAAVVGAIGALTLASTASAALPGKLVAKKSETDRAFLASPTLWTTSPNGCFDTFRQGYPCRRILRPDKIWIFGQFPNRVGWEFGDAAMTGYANGWRLICSKNRRIAERSQSDRDGLEPNEMWTGLSGLQLALPLTKPDWCEVDVEISSPYGIWGDGYEPWWNPEMLVTSEVQIRATSRSR